MKNQNPTIFISYSREHDRKEALALCRALTQSGHDAWIDEERVQPGQVWYDEVETALCDAKVVLVLLSNEMIASKSYAHDEWHMALEMQKDGDGEELFIIPVKLDDCKVPFLLRRFQWVNWFEASGKRRLMKRLDQIIKKRQLRNIDNPEEDRSIPARSIGRTLVSWSSLWRQRPLLPVPAAVL